MVNIWSDEELFQIFDIEKLIPSSDSKITPFVHTPFGDITPGKLTSMCYDFHIVFEEVFRQPVGFMGKRGLDRTIDEEIWSSVDEPLSVFPGYLNDQGVLHTPMAVYQVHNYEGVGFLLFQRGNYQIIDASQDEFIKQGKIEIYRGIGQGTDCGRDLFSSYRNPPSFAHALLPYLIPGLILVSNRWANNIEVSHIDSSMEDGVYPYWELDPLGVVKFPYSFSTSKKIASQKFGPNYVSFVTPLDNIRLFSAWTGENEVRLLDHRKVTDVHFHVA